MNKGQRENFLRKLHSLCGFIPLGIFLCFHMAVNFYAVYSPETYDQFGYFLSTMPYKVLLETLIILLPLAFHGIYGLVISFKSSANVNRFGYYRNWRYLLQRITGIIAFIFVAWHIYGTKIQVELLGIHPSFEMIHEIVLNPIWLTFFIVGVECCIYHFVNGLWSFMITWGITLTPRSQEVSQAILTVLYVIFAIVGLVAVLAFL